MAEFRICRSRNSVQPWLWMTASRHLEFCRKWNLTSAVVAADPYLSPYQIWWRYLLKKRWLSYGDLCVFKIAAAAILDFVESEIWRQSKLRLTHIYLHTKFDEDILKGGRVTVIYMFSNWRPAAILDSFISKIWRYFCFQDVGFSPWAKFWVNICNSDWVMVIKVNIQNGGCRHLGFCKPVSSTTHDGRLMVLCVPSNFVLIRLTLLKI